MLKMLRVMDASDANVAPAALQHKGSSMTGMMQRNDIALPQSLTTLRARNVLHRAAGLWPSLVQVPPYSAHHPILEAVAAKTVRAPCESWIVNHSFTKHANELLATVRIHKLLWVNFLLFWAAGRPCRKACKVLRILVRDLPCPRRSSIVHLWVEGLDARVPHGLCTHLHPLHLGINLDFVLVLTLQISPKFAHALPEQRVLVGMCR
mmetsp:Transcript_18089/g.42920  ORF Transcript_18089/g.42920 Transcript_18089/m.42920 type:complete len:207 (-) Transcript_18089:604-1224(-)